MHSIERSTHLLVMGYIRRGASLRELCPHVIRHCMHSHYLHVPLIGEKFGDVIS